MQLLGTPVQSRLLFSQHLQDLTRELSLLQIGVGHGLGESLPPRVLEIAAELNGPYAAFRSAPDAAVQAALAAGQDFCDVTYTVPPTVGPFLLRLGTVLDEADDFCRSRQHLLILPASEEVVAYRRWFVAESQRQLAGEAPRPWRVVPAADPGPPHPEAAAPPEVAAPLETSGPGPGGEPRSAAPPLVLESLASSVTAARRYVRGVLRDLDAEAFEEAAELAVSELVTNAVLHARTAFTVSVHATADGGVRVEVTDSSPVPLQPRSFAATSTTGRGLRLVASVCARWGVRDLPAGSGPGKTVWFEPRASSALNGPAGDDWALELEGLL
ncbi:anti-sigma regulatory factor (Ser/Thr protein kinase) [Kineococcus rhizosphaerae]|uniref:Anti-sigma regulatory factor (Ser/Thr protein kinase) n=1 Tax=Kineococcus rhizosphaerae TaxID=559628 RepID=A0A2T0R111_9ACTN|nr:anti-sigma regulatory factor (Ser/Thr protein kinase) [Kineococcus rhizosphaerae]